MGDVLTTSAIAVKPGLSRLLTGTRLDPRDSTGFATLVILLVFIVWLGSSIASFNGLIAVAGWAGLHGPIAVTVPIVIDGSILAFSLAALLQRAVGQSTLFSWVVAGVFTLFSSGANAAHVLLEPATDEATRFAGALIAALMPFSVFLSVHMLSNLMVQKPRKSPEELQAEIALKVETDRREQARAVEAQRLSQEEEARAQRQREKEAALLEHFEQIKDSPEAGEERDFFISYVIRAASQKNWVVSKTADALGITRVRVDTALSYRGGDLDPTTNEGDQP